MIQCVTPETSQAVAFPSLALRKITPDLLRGVVAPAVSLEAVSPSQAKMLFERVAAEVWLVTKVPDKDAVRPRPDVRRVHAVGNRRRTGPGGCTQDSSGKGIAASQLD